MASRAVLLHGVDEPIPVGALALAPGFVLRIGEARPSIAGGLSALRLGDDDAPRLLLTIGDRPARRLLLSRFEPVVVWRHDGTDTADEEIALGLASLRSIGGFGGRVIATIRDPDAVAATLDGAGPFEAAPAGPGAPAIPDEGGPILLLGNGVFCGRAVAPLLAAASLRGPLAPPWRRRDEDPFAPDGPGRLENDPGLRGAIAVEPLIVTVPGSKRDRRILAATFGSSGAGGGTTDGEVAERLRLLAVASGTPFDATVLDRFVVSWRPDGDDRPLGTLVDARALAPTLRAAAIRDALAGSRAPRPDPV